MFKFFLIGLVSLIVFLSNAAISKELLCSERDLSHAVHSFESKKAAESWFTKMIFLNEKHMNWVENNDEWFGEIPIDRYRDNTWEFYEDGAKFTAEFNPNKNLLKVFVNFGAGYKNTQPVWYRKCEVVKSAGSLGGN